MTFQMLTNAFNSLSDMRLHHCIAPRPRRPSAGRVSLAGRSPRGSCKTRSQVLGGVRVSPMPRRYQKSFHPPSTRMPRAAPTKDTTTLEASGSEAKQTKAAGATRRKLCTAKRLNLVQLAPLPAWSAAALPSAWSRCLTPNTSMPIFRATVQSQNAAVAGLLHSLRDGKNFQRYKFWALGASAKSNTMVERKKCKTNWHSKEGFNVHVSPKMMMSTDGNSYHP
mmetsp:Transcript_102536/g.258318  ORF Transcript_102536/g.258318 Transcript_102536/m.258318 type:complete len:223 (+) Transcript_102536:3020-3688(+)